MLHRHILTATSPATSTRIVRTAHESPVVAAMARAPMRTTTARTRPTIRELSMESPSVTQPLSIRRSSSADETGSCRRTVLHQWTRDAGHATAGYISAGKVGYLKPTDRSAGTDGTSVHALEGPSGESGSDSPARQGHARSR